MPSASPGSASPTRKRLSAHHSANNAAAVSPPVAGFLGDLIGIPGTVVVVSALTLAAIPFAFLLKDARRVASV